MNPRPNPSLDTNCCSRLRQPSAIGLNPALSRTCMLPQQRLTASLDGDFVVFLTGMRVNQPLRVDR
jgi:hypothetical protein